MGASRHGWLWHEVVKDATIIDKYKMDLFVTGSGVWGRGGRRRFGSALVLVLAALFLLAACDSSEKPAFQGGPRLIVEPASYDFGTVVVGTTIKVDFILKNVGDEPLIIDQAVTKLVDGCCPPQPALETQSLAPGKRTTMTLEFTMGSDMAYPHRFDVRITSNDPVSPVTSVDVKGDYVKSPEGTQ